MGRFSKIGVKWPVLDILQKLKQSKLFVHVEAVKNFNGKTSDRLICIYELNMHKRFVEGRKQL